MKRCFYKVVQRLKVWEKNGKGYMWKATKKDQNPPTVKHKVSKKSSLKIPHCIGLIEIFQTLYYYSGGKGCDCPATTSSSFSLSPSFFWEHLVQKAYLKQGRNLRNCSQGRERLLNQLFLQSIAKKPALWCQRGVNDRDYKKELLKYIFQASP